MPTKFPAVSICAGNAYPTDFSRRFLKNILAQNGIDNIFDFAPLGDSDSFKMKFGKYVLGLNALGPNVTNKMRKAMGYPLSDMLISCSFNSVKCTVNDFKWWFSATTGACYMFNLDALNVTVDDLMVTRPGVFNGLAVEFFTGESTDLSTFYYESGAYVLVNNKSVYPSMFGSVAVSTGALTNIAVDREFSERKPMPYSDCSDDVASSNSPLVKAILNTRYSYQQRDCIFLCFELSLIKTCSCRVSYFILFTV